MKMDFKVSANTVTINKLCESLDETIRKLEKVKKTDHWDKVNKLLGTVTNMPLEIFYEYERIDKNNLKLKVVMTGASQGSQTEKLAVKEVQKWIKKHGKEARIEVV